MIDTHAHIYDEQFAVDIENQISEAKALGVHRILMPNVDKESIGPMLDLERRFPGVCLPMMGLHPCYVDATFESSLHVIEAWLSKHKFVAVGEIGTDLYWDKTHWPQQQEAFKYQCELALKYDLPVVIHSRDSIDETIEMVMPFAQKGLTGVFHCFTGNIAQAQKIMELGFYLGIGGVVTFKNGGIDKVLPEIGMDKLVLETDSPYLAPTPHRGKRNSPVYLPLVTQKIATIFGLSVTEVVAITDRNANALFRLDEL